MSRRPRRLVVRPYRWLVALYPPAFRRRFGEAMIEDFRQLVESKGAGAAWLRAGGDSLRSLPMAWLRGAGLRSRPTNPASGAARASARLLRDLRFAGRSLRHDPGFTLTAVAVLGVAIGAGTAVLSVVNAYLLRPLPYPQAERLMVVRPVLPLTLDEAREVFELPLTWELDAFTLVGGDRPEQVRGSWVVPGHFEAYGITPALGRTFLPEEGGQGGSSVAIVSHGLWQRRWGGDPGILGRTVQTFSSDRPDDVETFTVVGVLPRDFWFHHPYTDFIVPLRAPNPIYQGRLRADITPERAEAALTELARGRVPELSDGRGVQLTPLTEGYSARVRPALVLLTAAVLLVLLIACGNVALLLVVRARRRERELSIRRALGAGRAAVAGQLLVEGLVLAALAGALGAGLAALSLELLGSVVQARLGLPVPGGAGALRLDATVLAGLAGVCALTGLLFGVAPLAGAMGGDVLERLRPGGRGASRGRRPSHGWVVAGELALSLALLVASGLAVRSAHHVSTVDLGYDPSGLVTSGLTLRERSYPDPAQRNAFQRRLYDAVERLPGVVSVGLARWEPIGARSRFMEAEGSGPADPARAVTAAAQGAGRGYLETLGIVPVRGRAFGPEDDRDAVPVALVSEALAAALWPGQDPLGRRLRELPPEGATAERAGEPDAWRTVVGVVPDVRQNPLDEPRGDYYVPLAQEAPPYLTIILRTRPGAAFPHRALEEAVAALDPNVAVAEVEHVPIAVREMSGPARFLALLLAGFGAVAVALAVLGLYGTVAYTATQRRRDVAIRMAVGARRDEVVRLFVRERLAVLAAGLAAGLVGAVFLTRLLEGQLWGVSRADPATYAAAGVLLSAVSLVAVWLPARGAARTDPMRILREE